MPFNASFGNRFHNTTTQFLRQNNDHGIQGGYRVNTCPMVVSGGILSSARPDVLGLSNGLGITPAHCYGHQNGP